MPTVHWVGNAVFSEVTERSYFVGNESANITEIRKMTYGERVERNERQTSAGWHSSDVVK